MKKANCQRNEGYQQRDVENLFKTETQHLSYEKSLDYKWDWHDGSTNSANQVIESLDLQKKEKYPIQHLVIHFCASIILWSIFIKFIF